MKAIQTKIISGGRTQKDGRIYGRKLWVKESDSRYNGSYQISSKGVVRIESAHSYYEIVDGYHRYQVLKTSTRINKRENGMLPVVVIERDINNRMASTIRHNRARGSHSIELMKNIVAELVESGMSDAWILKHIGMDADELLRLKQITGLAALFADAEFGQAWAKDEADAEFYA